MIRFDKQAFFAALLLLTISSCVSEIDKKASIASEVNKKKTFYATMEGSEPDTKVFADANMRVLWNADDRLTIFNQSTYNSQFRFTGDDGDNAGGFEEIPPTGFIAGNTLSNVYAVYPYSSTNKINNAGTTITLMLPAEQAYKEHSFGIGANTMIAATNNYFLAFKNVGGYLSLRLYGENVSVSRITLKGNNHEKIAGKAEIAVGVGTVPSVTMTNEATETVSIVCDPAVQLGTSSSNYTDFWFVIPPISFTQGFTVTVTDNLGGTFEVSTSKNFTISRSTVEWMSALKVVPNYDNAYVPFADANFKAYCVANYDRNDDGEISIAEALRVKWIYCWSKSIESLSGIENFVNLTELECQSNQLTDINISKNTALIYLRCDSNQLTGLDVSKNTALTRLVCYSNQLTSLDVSKNTILARLDCRSNQLTALDVSQNTALKELECDDNQLTSLDVSGNTALTYISCSSNQLTGLDVSKNIALTYLGCSSNQLTGLDVSKNTALTHLYCFSNQLTGLDVSKNTALTHLYCYSNQLTGLDVSKNTALTDLFCYSNQLTSLDVSKNTALTDLFCYSNQLTSLDVSKNTALTELVCDSNQLTSLDVTKNAQLELISCQSNQLSSLDVTKNTALSSLSCGNNNSPMVVLIRPGQLIPSFYHDSSAIIVETGDPIPQGNIAFADANFKAYCVQNFDKNNDGEISFAEALPVSIISCSSKSIQSLSGIEYFVNVRVLDFSSNLLTSLDISHNIALTYLSCSSNQLTSLDVSNNILLTWLYCDSNQLTSLDVSHNTALTHLYCNSNQLTSLDVSMNTALKSLYCDFNKLTSLDVSKNTSLEYLYCYSNQLTNLDVSHNTALKEMSCNSNPYLTEIWLKTNQTIPSFSYDVNVATIKYKD